MGKTPNVNITINSIEGIPAVKMAGQIQIRYGSKSAMTKTKSPLRTGHSSDIMESFTFPLAGPAIQFDVFHEDGDQHPIVCSGAHVISAAVGYTFDGPVKLLDKTSGHCEDPKVFISVTVM